MADNDVGLTRDDYINLKEGLARVRDNKKLFRRMLGLFLASEEFAGFEEYLAQKDFAKAADSAHAIKGMTGNLSLTRLFTISAQMMEDLRHGIYSEEAEAAYKEAYSQTRIHVEALIQELESE